MSIRCGHCKERHESAREVWSCGQIHKAIRPAQEPVEALAPLAPGFYRAGPKVFRLADDGAWALLLASGHWAGKARAPYRPERMSVEDVAAEGRRVVRCIVCGIKLTKPESVAAGIGPICRKRV